MGYICLIIINLKLYQIPPLSFNFCSLSLYLIDIIIEFRGEGYENNSLNYILNLIIKKNKPSMS